MRIFKPFLFALFILLTIKVEAGGGWTQPKNGMFFKLSEWWVISDQHYTNTGGIDPHLTRAIYNTSIYAEWGISEKLTGILYFPFFSRAVLNEQKSLTTGNVIVEGDALNSIGDPDLSLKYGLIQDKQIVLSASLTLGLPLGNDGGGRDGSLQTGDGEFNQMISIDASTSFNLFGINSYVSVNSGFNNRTNNYSDEIRYGAEVGLEYKRLILLARIIGIKSLNNGADNFSASGTSIFANNTEYLSFSPEVGFKISDKLGVSASYGTAFYGRLIFANPSYSAGVFLKL
ncbi:MAG TPA: hypothetical protein PKL31_08020 [Fulvivirga sp.]|nr:hypothetical protein [Fulvivirga sp.]